MNKKIFICFTLILFFNNLIIAQKNDSIDVVYLKNGNIVKGNIIESNSNVEIKFKTLDGSIILYSYNEFEKIEKSKNSFVNKKHREKIIFEKESFVIGGTSIHPSQTAGYVMVGKVKNFGGFLKLKTNLNFNSSFVENGNSWSNRYFNENVYTGRFALTGGVLWRVTKPIILYGGLGFGNRWVNWETISSQRFRVNDISYNGLELETGLIFNIKKFYITGGISTISLQYSELNFGIGIKL